MIPLLQLIQLIVSLCEVPNEGKQSLKVGSTQTLVTSVHTNTNRAAILLELTSSQGLSTAPDRKPLGKKQEKAVIAFRNKCVSL